MFQRQTWLSAAHGLAWRGDGGQPGDPAWPCALMSSRGRSAGTPTVLENLMRNGKNCSPNHTVKGRRRREEYILGYALKPTSAKAVSGFHVRYSNVPLGLVSYIFHICALSHNKLLITMNYVLFKTITSLLLKVSKICWCRLTGSLCWVPRVPGCERV